MKVHNPAAIAPPAGAYSHGIETAPGARIVHVAGQVGMRPDGTVPEDVGEQTRLTFGNIEAILAEAGMAMTDIVKITSFLVDPDDLPAFAAARVAAFGEHRPASTLVIVSRLVKPEWKVEVEAVAAKAV